MGAFADRIVAGRSCYIIWWMLSLKRRFVIKYKGIFMKAIIAFAHTLPEPTKERTRLPNTHIRAAWKILIDEYEHDGDVSDLLNWVIGEIKESDWKPRLKSPKNSWKNE